MKAYSLDFRCVVINAYESGEGTVEDVAEQCGVGTAFVKKRLRLHRAGERREPQPGGGAQAKLTAEARAQLRAAVKTRPAATLGELKAVLSSVCPVEVSAPTGCRELQKLEVPRKKRVASPARALSRSGKPCGGKWQRCTGAPWSSWRQWASLVTWRESMAGPPRESGWWLPSLAPAATICRSAVPWALRSCGRR